MEVFCTTYGRAGKEPAPILAEGESLSFLLEGKLVRGHRWLPGNADPPRVLIAHGFQSYSGNFEQYIRAMLAQGYEVLAFDAPAHGLSEGRQITLPLYVEMLRQVRQRYGRIDAYIGHSFGGLALTLMLESMPPDPGARLVLIAPACQVAPYVAYFFRLMRLNAATRHAFDELGRRLTGGLEWSWFSVRRAMPQVHLPVLWVQDEEDEVTPLAEALQVKAEGFVQIEWMITRGLGHRRIYRDQAVEDRIIAFFKQGVV